MRVMLGKKFNSSSLARLREIYSFEMSISTHPSIRPNEALLEVEGSHALLSERMFDVERVFQLNVSDYFVLSESLPNQLYELIEWIWVAGGESAKVRTVPSLPNCFWCIELFDIDIPAPYMFKGFENKFSCPEHSQSMDYSQLSLVLVEGKEVR